MVFYKRLNVKIKKGDSLQYQAISFSFEGGRNSQTKKAKYNIMLNVTAKYIKLIKEKTMTKEERILFNFLSMFKSPYSFTY